MDFVTKYHCICDNHGNITSTDRKEDKNKKDALNMLIILTTVVVQNIFFLKINIQFEHSKF